MPRGGRREGAGRRPVLSGELDWLWIGGLCEELWRKAAQEARAAKASKAEETKDSVRDEYAKARAVPVSERARWLQSQAGRDYRDDVVFALRAEQKTPDDREPDRLISVPATRPKGKRKLILAQVAGEATDHFGVVVSARRVEACWKKFRQLEQALRKNDATSV